MANNSRKVLVVDDEKVILELLDYNLKKEGYETELVNDGKKALMAAKEFNPDLILLDIMMPDQDGIETCRQLREVPQLNDTHIIFLTARSEEYSEIVAFETGADDYITKPIKPRALMSRLNAFFRKDLKNTDIDSNVSIGALTIDRSSYMVQVKGKPITLPKKEFDLLFFLAQNPNKVFTREELLQNIWGTDVYVVARTVDVHIRKVREKIGDGFILTVKGVGYKLVN